MAGIRPRRALLSLALALLAYFAPIGLEGEAHTLLWLTVLTGALWFSEAMPLHVTALLSTILLVLSGAATPAKAFSPYFSTTIVLFFGGFMMARAMQRHGLDRRIAVAFSSRFGTEPRMFLLGLMATCAFLSLWVSNTAATAMMLPIALFAISGAVKDGRKSSYAKSVVLGVAFAATIGGIGTIVGTPPNGIAVAGLSEAGIQVTFLEWMLHGMPFVVLFIPVSWLILTAVFPPEIKKVALKREKAKWGMEHWMISGVLALTIAVWVTSFLHGVSDAVVSVGAVIALYGLGLLETEDVSKIDWATLLLFGGGLSLGAAIDASGLGAVLGGMLGGLIAGQGLFVVMLAVAVFAVIMTLSASNTATAALLVPVLMPLSSVVGAGMKQLVILGAMGTSLDFIVPVGTPPSAIAYSSGYVSVGDMAKAGIWISIAGVLLLAGMAMLW